MRAPYRNDGSRYVHMLTILIGSKYLPLLLAVRKKPLLTRKDHKWHLAVVAKFRVLSLIPTGNLMLTSKQVMKEIAMWGNEAPSILRQFHINRAKDHPPTHSSISQHVVINN